MYLTAEDRRFTLDQLRGASYFSVEAGEFLVDLEIGLIEMGQNTFVSTPLTIPLAELVTGTMRSTRAVRFNHFLNLLYTLARLKYKLHDTDTVVFLGYR